MSNKQKLEIHRALHNGDIHVELDSKLQVIGIGRNGCRCLRTVDGLFMEQNKAKGSDYARRARAGEQITWIIRTGRWGLIIGSRIIVE